MLECIDDDEDDSRMYKAKTEVNSLDPPYTATCQWDLGCREPATQNVCQYDPHTMEGLIDGGIDADFCKPHARAMVARIGEYEI
jgi:hypothetical protein